MNMLAWLEKTRVTHICNEGGEHGDDGNQVTSDVCQPRANTLVLSLSLAYLNAQIEQLRPLDQFELLLAFLVELGRHARLPPEKLDHADDAHNCANIVQCLGWRG